MQNKKMFEIVMRRASEMLKDKKINSIYQSFATEDEAKDWIIKAALATLLVPPNKRKTIKKRNDTLKNTSAKHK